jgi:hypothetical protein
MRDFTQQLHEKLLIKLQDLDKNYDPLILPDRRLDLIVGAIEEVKQKLITHRFLSEDEEVHYFKSILPVTLSLYIYYSDRIEWDRIRLQGSPECRYAFTDRLYSQAENFRSVNRDFYEYCRDGKSYLDRFYFLRDSPGNRERVYSLRSIIDPCSPTIHCEMLATLIAFSKLEHELKMNVAENNGASSSAKTGKLKLRWTAKQIDLIELGYGLKETCSLNDGKASLNDIFDFFEESFEIDLGNTSRLFQDIIGRKAGNTIYLDLMKEKLRQKIDDILN